MIQKESSVFFSRPKNPATLLFCHCTITTDAIHAFPSDFKNLALALLYLMEHL